MLAQNAFSLLFLLAPLFLAQNLFAAGLPASKTSFSPSPTPEPQVAVDSPHGGDALQGMVSIQGMTDVPGFRSAEISFAYQTNPTGTWFLLQQSTSPVKSGSLAMWDTTTITDGTYQVRLQVFLGDGQVRESLVSGLRVRNYSLVETSTPEVEVRPAGQDTPTPTASPRPDFQVKAIAVTPLPTNPAEVTAWHLENSAGQGVLVVFGASLAAVLYLGLRALIRR